MTSYQLCRPNILLANCLSAKYFVGQIFCWPNILSAKYFVSHIFCRPNILSAKYFVGQIFCRPNILSAKYFCQPSILSAKYFIVNVSVDQMLFDQKTPSNEKWSKVKPEKASLFCALHLLFLWDETSLFSRALKHSVLWNLIRDR